MVVLAAPRVALSRVVRTAARPLVCALSGGTDPRYPFVRSAIADAVFAHPCPCCTCSNMNMHMHIDMCIHMSHGHVQAEWKEETFASAIRRHPSKKVRRFICCLTLSL
eukprot:2278642-Prymnesium_polylepis.1